MSDNVTLPATGEIVATDEVGGFHFQRVKLVHGADGVAVDASPASPFPVEVIGELIEAVEAIRVAISALTRTIGLALPNAQGQPIMEVRQPTAGNLNVTASIAGSQTLATLTTLSTLTNQQQVGGFSANDTIPATMHMQCDGLRANITVT